MKDEELWRWSEQITIMGKAFQRIYMVALRDAESLRGLFAGMIIMILISD